MRALVADRSFLSRVSNMLLGKSFGTGVSVHEVSKPTINANEILIKVHANALNPIDFKFIDFIAPQGSRTGCDFAGEVSQVGKSASSTWKVGDRVAGFVQGGINNEIAAFADYVKAEQDLVWKIPEGVSFATASTYGVPGVTAMQALNHNLSVPWLDEAAQGKLDTGSPILIYAGSTSVGLFAIQLAKAAGCTVVTTCSPRSFDLVESYGADAAFDYRSSTAIQDIKAAYPNISRALDCISEGGSTLLAARVLEGNSGKVITLLDSKAKVTGVEVKMIMSFQMLGHAFQWLAPVGPKYPVSPPDRAALVRFYGLLPGFVSKVKPLPVKLLEGGYTAVLEGLQKLREGDISRAKLVVKH